MSFSPKEIWIERGEEDSPVARTVVSRFPEIPRRSFDRDRSSPADGIPRVDFSAAKQSLVLQRQRGGFLEHCPAGTPGMVCCNYLVVNFASNCPFDCSYCFLQDYLATNNRLTAFTNVEEGLAEIDRALSSHPQRQFRIGTGELADSLALDPVTGLSRQLVPFFAERDNAVLELKTKSDDIGELLDLDPRGRVVVGWSINPENIVGTEEHGTASLEARLDAARRVAVAGYGVGFHFDPIVEHEGWRESYGKLIEQIFDAVEIDRLSWFSLGALRMTPSLRRAVRSRPATAPAQHVLGAELVPGGDGKLRLWRGLRVQMYRFILERLRASAPETPIYLCMEPPSVWQRAMKEVPSDRQLGIRLAAGGQW